MSIFSLNSMKMFSSKTNKISNRNPNNKKGLNLKVLLLIKSDKKLNKKKGWKEKREKTK